MSAFQMTSIMEGVVQSGTAQRLKVLKRPIAGKTGTTNDYKDAWFVGYTPDLAIGVYIGYDQPASMGHGETGGSLAAPVVRDFLKEALKDVPPVPFRAPTGMKLVRVNHKSGLPASAGDKTAILEAFKPGQEPAGSVSEDVIEGGEMAEEAFGPSPPDGFGPSPPPPDGYGPPPPDGYGPPPPPPPPFGRPPGPGNDRALTSGTGGLY
jgi:penicillin-binding protein 1A